MDQIRSGQVPIATFMNTERTSKFHRKIILHHCITIGFSTKTVRHVLWSAGWEYFFLFGYSATLS
jgi:hypothetical protein